MILEQEVAFYRAHKKELLRLHKGKFVLIKGERLVDVFETARSAYAGGLKEFGNVPFLIQEVREREIIETIPGLSYGARHGGD